MYDFDIYIRYIKYFLFYGTLSGFGYGSNKMELIFNSILIFLNGPVETAINIEINLQILLNRIHHYK